MEARFGLRLCARLSEASADLPHDVTERLRVARGLALERARAKVKVVAVQAAAHSDIQLQRDGSAVRRLGGDPNPWWVRLTSLAPLLLLVVGFLVIQEWERNEQIAAAADIDTALLSDTLPPEAYADPGFNEFLMSADTPGQP
ncbi:MAG: DUF3619 family protein [Burkholderiales bacterium]